jgi:hypothetical protein
LHCKDRSFWLCDFTAKYTAGATAVNIAALMPIKKTVADNTTYYP